MYGFATIFGSCLGTSRLGHCFSLVLVGLCSLFALPPPLMADDDCFLSEDDVYDLWNDFCSSYDPDLASRCDSARDYYLITGDGFRGEWGAIGDPVTISGEFVLSNGLCFVSGFPVAIIDNFTHPPFLEESANLWPVPGSDFALPSTLWNNSLIRSIWNSPYVNFEFYTNYYTPFLASNSFLNPSLTNQPHGRVISSGFRVTWSNFYLSRYSPFVRYAPFWWASTGDCRVTEEGYYEITGEIWPYTNTYIRLTRDVVSDMIRDARWRILERWR